MLTVTQWATITNWDLALLSDDKSRRFPYNEMGHPNEFQNKIHKCLAFQYFYDHYSVCYYSAAGDRPW